jgi:hypothetical protein
MPGMPGLPGPKPPERPKLSADEKLAARKKRKEAEKAARKNR